MGRLLLIDNDALLKLARYGLLDESIALFGCVPTDVRVLATAKYSLLPAKNRLRLCEDEESATRLEEFLRTSEPLNAESANPDLLDALNAVQNIDAGESLLLAVGATDGGTLVITGDKRSLAALCRDSVAHVFSALAGRVVPMEVIFSHLVEYQFAYVQERVNYPSPRRTGLSVALILSQERIEPRSGFTKTAPIKESTFAAFQSASPCH